MATVIQNIKRPGSGQFRDDCQIGCCEILKKKKEMSVSISESYGDVIKTQEYLVFNSKAFAALIWYQLIKKKKEPSLIRNKGTVLENNLKYTVLNNKKVPA